MAITETKLINRDKFRIKNYNIVRKNRNNNTRAGGVLILIKKGIPYVQIQIPETSIETVGIKLANNINFIAAYNKPQNKISDRDLNTLTNIGNKVRLVGDLNARHTTWNCHISNQNGRIIKNYADNNHIHIKYPQTHTHYPSNNTTPTTIDIAITKNIENITQLQSLTELNSDHNPVAFQMETSTRNSVIKQITSYQKTDWKKFRETLDKEIIINPEIQTAQQLEIECHNLIKALQTAKKKHTQTKTIDLSKDKL
ncbi:Exo endo phos 2 domain containing protein, partial [Asbolus verrucosus]